MYLIISSYEWNYFTYIYKEWFCERSLNHFSFWTIISAVNRFSYDTQGFDGCLLYVHFVSALQGEDVNLVGDFTGNWKEPIKAIHKGGSRYEVEVRLSQGK